VSVCVCECKGEGLTCCIGHRETVPPDSVVGRRIEEMGKLFRPSVSACAWTKLRGIWQLNHSFYRNRECRIANHMVKIIFAITEEQFKKVHSV